MKTISILNGADLNLAENSPTICKRTLTDLCLIEKSVDHRPHQGLVQKIFGSPQDAQMYKMVKDGFTSSPVAFKLFPQAILNKKYGIVITKDGELIEQTLGAQRWVDPTLSFLEEVIESSKGQLDLIGGISLFASHGNYCVYSHFVCETACSIFALREQIIQKGIKIVLPRMNVNYVEAILDALEIPIEQRLYLSDGHCYQFENLIVSSTCASGATYAPSQLLMKMSSYFKDLFCEQAVESNPKRLYLTRHSAKIITGNRFLKNDVQLAQCLSQLGFITVDPSSLPWQEQVKLFSQAEIIVGPHGSAFANMIFMGEGSRVLDIIPEHWSTNGLKFTSSLSNLARLHYSYLIASSTEIQGGYESFIDPQIVIMEVCKLLKS